MSFLTSHLSIIRSIPRVAIYVSIRRPRITYFYNRLRKEKDFD